MKIGIVGSGFVGSSAAFALVMRGIGREVILVDVDASRARAEADDILHGVPFAKPLTVTAGDYEALSGCRLVIVAAGVGQKPGETRLQLLARNAAVFQQVIPSILKNAPDAILIVATNPVDVMTHLAAGYAADFGVPSSRVLGSGTMLDSARFRALLGRHLDIDARHVHAYVVGEHGDSEVLAWSAVRVGAVALEDFAGFRGAPLNRDTVARIDDGVRNAAYRIIEGKAATYYGVASALAHMADVILHDQRSLMTVCTPQAWIADVSNVTVSMPHVVGGEGVIGDHHPLQLDDSEQEALHASASLIRGQLDQLEQASP
jgi:L-lactate dehydrogenase